MEEIEQSTPDTNVVNFKLFELKNVLIVAVVYSAYYLMSYYLGLMANYLLFVGLIMAFMAVQGIKNDPVKASDNVEMQKAVAFMALSPLLSQAFYYYGLKKTNVELANSFNKLGWKVFGLEIILAIIINLILALGFGIGTI